MPEIRQNFTGGKMNKDLDERLVPNGEYRDAMNIQVSTSDDSDVGTIQNVLGNTPGCDVEIAPPNSYTVGSVSDEKNDTLYWLVSGQETVQSEMSDMILRRKPDPSGGGYVCEAVFVDKFAFTIALEELTNLPLDGIVNSIEIYSGTGAEIINEGWTVTGTDNFGNVSSTVTVTSVSQSNSFHFDWNFVTSNTPVYNKFCVGSGNMCNGSDILIPLTATVFDYNTGNPIEWVVSNNNQIYLEGYSGPSLVNSFIDVDPYTTGNPNFGTGTSGPNNDEWEIINQVQTSLFLTDANNNMIISPVWEQLTLDSSFTIGGNFALNPVQPQPTQWDPATFTAFLNIGPVLSNTPAMITEPTGNFVQVPDNGWITLPAQYDVTNFALNDPITLNAGTPFEFQGCVNAFDVTNNWIQVVDCGDPTIFAEPQMVSYNTYAAHGSITLDNLITIDLGGVDLDLSLGYTSLIFQGPRVLNFNHGDLILGINIIDEFLYWTDNKTEPKKISIPRSVAGTDPTGTIHTDIILPDNSGNLVPGINKGPAREEHVTVIKKAPHRPPSLKMSTKLREGSIGDGYSLEMIHQLDAGGNLTSPPLYNYIDTVGEVIYVKIPHLVGAAPDFKVGDLIGAADGSLVPDPFGNGYQIRFKILEINEGPWLNPSGIYSVAAGETAYLIEVASVSADAPSQWAAWKFELIDDEKYLFERKLPRFAYRYKYVDNEYSTYGPFSDVAFHPGEFEYQPVKAYNEGMTNRIRSLTLFLVIYQKTLCK